MSDYDYLQEFESGSIEAAQRSAVLHHGYESREWKFLRDWQWFLFDSSPLPFGSDTIRIA